MMLIYLRATCVGATAMKARIRLAVGQAVKNNPEKFPAGYVAELTAQEVEVLRSKILTLEAKPGKGHYSKHGYKVFTERGLYMLATILKGERAVRATFGL